MATRGELMAAGMPAGQAIQIGASLAGSTLVAAGTTKATALALTGTVALFGTVSSGKGASLPQASASAPVVIYNGGSNSLLVYTGNATDTINVLSAGASFSVTNGKSAIFWPHGNLWVANLSA